MHFRVKIGYGKNDFILIDEDELTKAIYAQVTGKVGLFKEGTISGNAILSITPDYNKEMGWRRGYQPDSEDWWDIGEKRANKYREFMIKTKEEIYKQIGTKINEPLKLN